MIENISLNIPSEIAKLLASGDAARYGSVIRTTSGQIICHLRETNELTQNFYNINNIVNQAMVAGETTGIIPPYISIPVRVLFKGFDYYNKHQKEKGQKEFFTQNFETVQSQNKETHSLINQLGQQISPLQGALSAVNMLSAVNLISSVVSIGMIASSFYFINKKLNLIASELEVIKVKLDGIDSKVTFINNLMLGQLFADLKTSLDQMKTLELRSEKDKKYLINSCLMKFNSSKNRLKNAIDNMGTSDISIYNNLYKALVLSIIGEIQCSLYLESLDLAYHHLEEGNKLLIETKEHFKEKEAKDQVLNLIRRKIGTSLIGNEKIDKIEETIEEIFNSYSLIHTEMFERVDSYKYEIKYLKDNGIKYTEWLELTKDYEKELGLIYIPVK